MCIYIYIYSNFGTSILQSGHIQTLHSKFQLCTVWTGGAPPKSSVHQETYVDSGISTLEPSRLPLSWESSHLVHSGVFCIFASEISLRVFHVLGRPPNKQCFFLNRGKPTLRRFGASRKTIMKLFKRWSRPNDIRYTYIYLIYYT